MGKRREGREAAVQYLYQLDLHGQDLNASVAEFWDLRTGQELFGLRRHATPVTVIEFAAGGKLLVTAGEGQLAVWDARE